MSNPQQAAEGRKTRYFWPVVAKIALDLVVPTAGYYGLRAAGLTQLLALCLTTVPAIVYYGYRIWRGQKVDSFETFVLLIIASTDATSFISGSPRLSLSEDGWIGLILAASCLISLRTRRPLVYRFIQSLLDNTPLRVKHHTDEWDAMWAKDPSFRRPWIVSTVVWAVANTVVGVLRLGVAYLAPVDLAPLVLGVITIALVIGIQLFQTMYLRRCFKAQGAFISPLVRLGLPAGIDQLGVQAA
jgi:hypothetical protein